MERSGRLRLDLYDAHGEGLQERVDVFLYHQTLSEVVAVRDVPAAKAFVVRNLRTAPQGLYRVFVDPPSYLPATFFVNVRASGITDRALPFAVDPAKVLRVDFPEWHSLAFAHRLLETSKRVLGFDGLSGEALYAGLDDLRRAGMLNILAKCRQTPVAGTGVVFDQIRELRELRQDRFFAVVPQALREHVKNGLASGLFQEVSGALHRPPDGFSPAGSYKTDDRYGNLQLTFFASPEEWLADIDIDDANGLEHVFQVLRNHITGSPTHPYHIHDILLRHQEIDPGYRLIVRTTPAVRTAGQG